MHPIILFLHPRPRGRDTAPAERAQSRVRGGVCLKHWCEHLPSYWCVFVFDNAFPKLSRQQTRARNGLRKCSHKKLVNKVGSKDMLAVRGARNTNVGVDCGWLLAFEPQCVVAAECEALLVGAGADAGAVCVCCLSVVLSFFDIP